MIKNCLNPEGHQNPISGSKVTVILLQGWILPIGGVAIGKGRPLQPAQQACLYRGSNLGLFTNSIPNVPDRSNEL